MKYTAKYFRDGMPDWKRKKDPIICRIFFRPLSFYTASICANCGISANIVSVLSTFVGIAACVCFALPAKAAAWFGCLFICLWLLMDCTDGNLARSVKMQPFGDFVDAMSSYVLVGLLGVTTALNCYTYGGLLFPQGNVYIVLLGALGSSSDTLMRLIYQKYQANSRDLQSRGIIPSERDVRTEHSSVGSLRVRLEMELGVAGLIPVLAIICTWLGCLDILVIYMALYYGGSCLLATSLYTNKALKYLNTPMK